MHDPSTTPPLGGSHSQSSSTRSQSGSSSEQGQKPEHRVISAHAVYKKKEFTHDQYDNIDSCSNTGTTDNDQNDYNNDRNDHNDRPASPKAADFSSHDDDLEAGREEAGWANVAGGGGHGQRGEETGSRLRRGCSDDDRAVPSGQDDDELPLTMLPEQRCSSAGRSVVRAQTREGPAKSVAGIIGGGGGDGVGRRGGVKAAVGGDGGGRGAARRRGKRAVTFCLVLEVYLIPRAKDFSERCVRSCIDILHGGCINRVWLLLLL